MDPQTLIRMSLLVRDADLASYAFYRTATDDVMLVPAGMPQLNAEVESQMKNGFVLIGVVVLSKRTSPDGHALIEYEELPGMDAGMQKARTIFQDQLAEQGIIKPAGPVN
jgi:hypothetical protein